MGGSTINCTSPIDNITLPDDLSATQIAVGAYASCVIQINGGVSCWEKTNMGN